MGEKISRRDFLKAAGILSSSALLTTCAPKLIRDPILNLTAVPTSAPTEIPSSSAEAKIIEGHESEIMDTFLQSHPEFEGKEGIFTTLRVDVNGNVFDTVAYQMTPDEEKSAEYLLAIVDTDNDLEPDTKVATLQNIIVFTTNEKGEWKSLKGLAIPKKDGRVVNSWGIPAINVNSDVNEESSNIFSYVVFEIENKADNRTVYFWPDIDPKKLNNWDGNAFVLAGTNPIMKVLARPYIAPEPAATVNPEAWSSYDHVLVQNRNVSPYDKQLIVNPDYKKEFATKVFDLCNQYTFLSEMAYEIQKRRNPSPLPETKYKSFEDYMSLVIQPKIDAGDTMDGYHIVGHEKDANRLPYVGMVEPLGEFDPSVCSIKLAENSRVFPNGIVVVAGSFQIGMELIEKDGVHIRQLVIAPNKTTKNSYGLYFASEKTTVEENAVSYSQMIEVAFGQFENIMKMVEEKKNGITTYKSTVLVTGRYEQNSAARIIPAVPGSRYVETDRQWMSEAPDYLLPNE